MQTGSIPLFDLNSSIIRFEEPELMSVLTIMNYCYYKKRYEVKLAVLRINQGDNLAQDDLIIEYPHLKM